VGRMKCTSTGMIGEKDFVSACDEVLPHDVAWFEELTAAFMAVAACRGAHGTNEAVLDAPHVADDIQEPILQLFAVLDSDDKGSISASWLPKLGVALLGKRWSTARFSAITAELSLPVSTMHRVSPLQFDSFINECLRGTLAADSEAILGAACEEAVRLLQGGRGHRRRQRLRASFAMFDIDESGRLDKAELQRVLGVAAWGSSLSPVTSQQACTVEALVHHLKSDAEGYVTVTAFVSTLDECLPAEGASFDRWMHVLLSAAEQWQSEAAGCDAIRIWPQEDVKLNAGDRIKEPSRQAESPLRTVQPGGQGGFGEGDQDLWEDDTTPLANDGDSAETDRAVANARGCSLRGCNYASLSTLAQVAVEHDWKSCVLM